jgi:hypothetical protein
MHNSIRIFFNEDQEIQDKGELVSILFTKWAFQTQEKVTPTIMRAEFLHLTMGPHTAEAELLFPLVRDGWLDNADLDSLGIHEATKGLLAERIAGKSTPGVKLWVFYVGFHTLYHDPTRGDGLVQETSKLLNAYEGGSTQ